jgi:hypothetical protein
MTKTLTVISLATIVLYTSAQCLEIANCESCPTGNCNQCIAGYSLASNNNTCVPCPQYCDHCTLGAACDECADTFISNGQGGCTCQSDSYLNLTNQQCATCSSALSNCLACTSAGSGTARALCSSCQAPYVVNPYSQACACPPGSGGPGCSIVGCLTPCAECAVGSNTACTKCESGYTLDENTCLEGTDTLLLALYVFLALLVLFLVCTGALRDTTKRLGPGVTLKAACKDMLVNFFRKPNDEILDLDESQIETMDVGLTNKSNDIEITTIEPKNIKQGLIEQEEVN